MLTWQVPGIGPADLDLRDDRGRQGAGERLPPKVLDHELLISRVEPEPRRQFQHPVPTKSKLLHRSQFPQYVPGTKYITVKGFLSMVVDNARGSYGGGRRVRCMHLCLLRGSVRMFFYKFIVKRKERGRGEGICVKETLWPTTTPPISRSGQSSILINSYFKLN